MEQTNLETVDFSNIIDDSLCSTGPVQLFENQSKCSIVVPFGNRITRIRMKKTRSPACLNNEFHCLKNGRRILIQPNHQYFNRNEIDGGGTVSVEESYSEEWEIKVEGQGISITGLAYANNYGNNLCKIRLRESIDRRYRTEITYICEENIRAE